MIHLITYCSDNMTKAAELCKMSAMNNGATVSICHTKDDIDKDFYLSNRTTLRQQRGDGYWLWKPYFINRWMLIVPDGNYIVYSDAGVEFVNDISHIIEKMDEDIFFFGNNYNHADWCKRDVVDTILPGYEIDRPDYTRSFFDLKQIQASVIFFKVNQRTREFVKEWLLYCQMPGFVDDSPSKLPNYPTFAEHRHDQAVLTCLQIKHGYKLHWWPAQYNGGAFVYDKIAQYRDDKYPVIFHHHRKRNNEW